MDENKETNKVEEIRSAIVKFFSKLAPNLRLRTDLPDDVQRVITSSRPIPQLV